MANGTTTETKATKPTCDLCQRNLGTRKIEGMDVCADCVSTKQWDDAAPVRRETMNKGGKKIASILMNHDVIFTSAERWGMLQFFAGHLRQIDRKRYDGMVRRGIL